jgi:murein DD-endopeptidase / murein LD-carboxypeptidase
MTVAWPQTTRMAIVAAVRAAVGTSFRPQGRTPGLALDCVGVALLAARAAGVDPGIPPAYAIGGDNKGRVEPMLAALGLVAVTTAAPGDLLLIAPSPRHRHLAVVTPTGVVHAHAGLGCVVEGPLDPAWTVIGVWRFPGV